MLSTAQGNTFYETAAILSLAALLGVISQRLRNIPLRSVTGVSILAASRAGRVHYEPGPDFQVCPGDRIVLMGSPEVPKKAESLINRMADPEAADKLERFVIAEIQVPEDSLWSGRTLAELQFRQEYGVTVVGIRRSDVRITSPSPNQKLTPTDRVVVIGTSDKVSRMRRSGPS